jgi:hypothetical protein
MIDAPINPDPPERSPMTGHEFRAMALALPEAIEAPHYSDPAFRVGKKMFATMNPEETRAIVKVAPRERFDALLAAYPECFSDIEKYSTSTYGALGVHLPAVDPALLRELLTDSWADVAPKRARAALVQQLANG